LIVQAVILAAHLHVYRKIARDWLVIKVAVVADEAIMSFTPEVGLWGRRNDDSIFLMFPLWRFVEPLQHVSLPSASAQTRIKYIFPALVIDLPANRDVRLTDFPFLGKARLCAHHAQLIDHRHTARQFADGFYIHPVFALARHDCR